MRYYFILLALITTKVLSGQILEDKNLYIKSGGCIGNYYGGKISLEYINRNQQSFSIGIYGQGRLANNIPEDYVSPSGWLGKVFFFGLKLDYPTEERTTCYLTTGKIYKVNNSKIRFDISGGLGCSYLKTPVNFLKSIPAPNSAENYSYNYKKEYSLGLIINPSVDLTWKYFGLSLGLISIISKDRFSYGLEISYLIGFVNNARNKN